jgi:hypothetical protein
MTCRPPLSIRALAQRIAVISLSVVAWSVVPSIANEDTMGNQIHVIAPYRQAATWVFDDPAVGLKGEPFVSGIPEMIDALVQGVPRANRGFRLLFSAAPFPRYQVELIRLRSEYGGNWYRWTATDMEGWLCPALSKYFPEPPATLYARAEGF